MAGPRIGEHVNLLWGEQGAVAVVAGAPAQPPPPATLPDPDTPHEPPATAVIDARPTTALTWRNNQWVHGRPSLPDAALFWYGPSMLQADGHSHAANLRLTRTLLGPDTTTLTIATHTMPAPDGPPEWADTVTVAVGRGETVTVDLGPDVGQAMLDGHATGIAIHGTDHITLLGPDDDPLSGQLTITYTRSL